MLVCLLGSSPPSIRFISVSNSLPKTSYVKMIDIWLLFNLTIPFVEVNTYSLWTIECNLTIVPLSPGPPTNLHRVPPRAGGGEEDNQPSRKRSWGWSWSRVGEAVFDPSVWFEVSEQVKLASSGKKDWSFSVVLVRHMGSSFQSTKKYSARPWRNFMKGSRLVDVYKKKIALKVFFPARPRSRE